MHIWEYALLAGAALAGGTFALVLRTDQYGAARWLTAFSGAYLLGLAVTHLIPDLYAAAPKGGTIGFWILGGFSLQLLLEPLSKGIEHGHLHRLEHIRIAPIMLGLLIHAIVEGLPLSGYAELEAHQHAGQVADQLFFGIVVHKAPAAFALASVLLNAHISRGKVMALVGLFALATPGAAFLSSAMGVSPNHLYLLLALVTGSFLHLSTSILFESSPGLQHAVSWEKFAAIVSGFVVSVLTT
jgi:zinc transporter ZupT